MDQPHVAALNGSLRDASKTRIVLEAALESAAESGARTSLLDLREYQLPAYDPDTREPADVATLSRTVADAEAVVLGTPNYHGSYSGVLKNTLDYLGRDEFEGTTVGLVEVAGGEFPGPALEHLRRVARTLNAWTLPLEVGVPSSHETVGRQGIRDESVQARVEEFGRELARYAGVERFPQLRDSTEAEVAPSG